MRRARSVILSLGLALCSCGGSAELADSGAPRDAATVDTGVPHDAAGADAGPPTNVVVVVAPATVSLATGASQDFTATVTGAATSSVTWSASGGTIDASGHYVAPASGGGFVVRATSTDDPRASGTAVVVVTGGAYAPEPFYDSAHPYVQIMSPMPSATYFAPATIRIWAHAPDYGPDNVNNYSPRVDFYLGTQQVGSVQLTASDPVDQYEVDLTGIPAGSYEIYARSVISSGTVESVHVPITVIDVPAHAGGTMELTEDLVLSGDASFELIGTETARALLTSRNGSRIRSAPGWTGHFTLRHADVIGLGSMDVPSIEIDAVGTSAIEISDSVFDRTGPPSIGAEDAAPITFRGNTLQPNVLTPVGAEPDYAGSHPSLVFHGGSSAPKVFAGNDVGVSFVRFDHSSHWTIGGDHDADGNVLLGVRAGIEIDAASDFVIRGNVSYHRYPFGWSQGHNLDFEGECADALVEHNVFRSSSWMIQGLPGEFRYNLLVDNINEAFFRNDGAIAVHHNVLVNASFQRLYVPSGGVLYSSAAFYSNTVDVGGAQLGWLHFAFMPTGQQLSSVRNDVFMGFAYETPTDLIEAGATASADYNCFFNPDTSMLTRYGDPGLGVHDCGGGASTDPSFARPRAIPFPIADADLWQRNVTVSAILALYRAIYTPAPGSPLIDAGDPADDTGGMRNTDIGAIGAGMPHPDDRFGLFGP